MNKKIRLCMDIVLAIILVWFDQFTKRLAVAKLMNITKKAFGMFQGQRIMILIVGAVLIFGLLFLMLRMPQGRKYTIFHVILTFVIAGGIGNIIDRVSLEYVIDFISFVLINFPIFNVADCYVVCGVIAMCIMLLFVFKDEDLDFLSFKKVEEKED